MRIVQRVRGPWFFRRTRYYVVGETRWSRRGRTDVVFTGRPVVEFGPFRAFCEAYSHLRIARAGGLLDAMEALRDAG